MDHREEIRRMKLRNAVLLARHREASARVARLLQRLVAILHPRHAGSAMRPDERAPDEGTRTS